MDLEVRELPNADRGKLMGRMKSYQNEFNRLETQVVGHTYIYETEKSVSEYEKI